MFQMRSGSLRIHSKLITHQIKRSNSRKGNCWDNPVAESYFSTLKKEMETNMFHDIEDAKECILKYFIIDKDYILF